MPKITCSEMRSNHTQNAESLYGLFCHGDIWPQLIWSTANTLVGCYLTPVNRTYVKTVIYVQLVIHISLHTAYLN